MYKYVLKIFTELGLKKIPIKETILVYTNS